MLKSLLRRTIERVDQWLGLRQFLREGAPGRDLAGDRAIEWSWVVAHLPKIPSRVLDVGCVSSALAGIACRAGHAVTAVDLRRIEYRMPGVSFRQGDVLEIEFADAHFDAIINCSTIEHIGLADRYGSRAAADGDLCAMKRLATLVAPGGTMLLTLPVGRDAEFPPYHRVYGAQRLPRLLDGYEAIAEEFWAKDASGVWDRCDRSAALSTEGSSRYYALGLFLLAPRAEPGSGRAA